MGFVNCQIGFDSFDIIHLNTYEGVARIEEIECHRLGGFVNRDY